MSARGAALAVIVALGVMTPALAAAAKPGTNACIAAFDRGQRARSDKQLRLAQTELLVCTQESCPAVLRADCAGVLRSVQAAVPTIVLAADDGEGHDVTAATVHVGSESVAEKLDGRAIEFDPGTYDIRFDRPDAEPVTVHVVLREGEKNRAVRASFAKKPSAVVTAPSPVDAVDARPVQRPVVGYVVPVGLAVLGVGAFTVAGVSRLSFDGEVEDMRARCAPECTQSERADLSSTLVTANVALGIGIGAIALAAASWFFLEPRPAKRAATLTRWAW